MRFNYTISRCYIFQNVQNSKILNALLFIFKTIKYNLILFNC